MNVGGTFVCVEKYVLTSVEESLLEYMFSGRTEMPKKDGRVTVYRNAKIFMLMINYLRDEMLWLPVFDNMEDEQDFFNELRYWKIDP